MPIGPTSGFLDFTNATPRANVIIALSNVGVGTDLPLHALDIRGTANVADIIINNDLTLIGGLTTNTLTINSMSMSTTSNFQQVTNVGDAATTNTVQFTNPTTGFTVSSNAEVGGELSVSGNTEVGTANLFVDTTTGNVGVGTTEPTESLDIVGNLNLQKVSNTASIKLNSNVVTEYTRSKKLIKYPRVALNSASQDGYVISSSTDAYISTKFHMYDPFRPFVSGTGTDSANGWHTGPPDISVVNDWDQTFDTSGYNKDVTSYGVGGYSGTSIAGIESEWLKLELPHKIILSHFYYQHRNGESKNYHQAPRDFRILGSNDDVNWDTIKMFTGETSLPEGKILTAEASKGYKYLAFVVTKTWTVSGTSHCTLKNLEYYGVPEYDPEAHGTDVIMRSVPNVPNTDWLEVYYDAKDLADGTVATVNDLKPSGLGTALNSSSTNNITVSDGAFVFNGTTSYIKIDDLTNPSGAWTHSVVAWINSSDLGMFDLTWIGDADAATTRQSFTFQEGGQNLTLGINANNVQFTFSPPLQKSKWHHVVYTFNGGAAGSASTAYKVFVDGVEANKTGGAGTGTLSLPGDSAIWIGRNITGTNYFKGSIANFRVFNRALGADEIWQLYAYQKDYFQVSPDVVTFKGGRLGIGTSEPRAPLDVMGIPYGPGARPIFSAYESDDYSVTATGYIVLGNTFVNGLNCYNTSTGIFVAPLDGIYCFIGNCVMRSSSGGSGNSTWTFHINGTNWNPTSTGRPIAYQAIDSGTNHQQTSGSLIFYLNKGDSVRIYAGAVPSNTNQNWGQGYGRFLGFLLS